MRVCDSLLADTRWRGRLVADAHISPVSHQPRSDIYAALWWWLTEATPAQSLDARVAQLDEAGMAGWWANIGGPADPTTGAASSDPEDIFAFLDSLTGGATTVIVEADSTPPEKAADQEVVTAGRIDDPEDPDDDVIFFGGPAGG